jgi:hypothetical protein
MDRFLEEKAYNVKSFDTLNPKSNLAGIDMKTLKSFKIMVVWFLILMLALPPPLFAQGSQTTVKKFTQQELDQILAPIALYPDSLLGQVLMAATYPLEVVMADRWIKQNPNLKGKALIDAADKQNWDASVKALVAFPDVLAMMSEKMEWTQDLGDAFLAQPEDVSDTVQKLRDRAFKAGNLKTTEQQTIVVEREIIRIEPATPQVIYVPYYDPWWVYGPWWWPAYPPYVIYPYRPAAVVAPGVIWFGVGFTVGVFWTNVWGHWDWNHRHIYVNPHYYGRPYPGYRPMPVGTAVVVKSPPPVQQWSHEPYHRRGVVYRDQPTREKYRQIDRNAVNSRRDFRGYEGGRAPDRARRPDAPTGKISTPAAPTGRTEKPGTQIAKPARPAAPDEKAVKPGVQAPAPRPAKPVTPDDKAIKPGTAPAKTARPDTSVSRPPAAPRAPERPADRPAIERGKPPQALQGMGRGKEVRQQSNWGRASREAVKAQPAPRAAPKAAPQVAPQTAPKAAPQAAPRGGAGQSPKGGDKRGGPGGGSH